MVIKETQTKTQEVSIGTKCDCCGKETREIYPDTWHHFDSYHSDWGNDLCDSYEYFDACSPQCFLTIIKKEFSDGHGIETPDDRSSVMISDFHEQFLFELLKLIP